MVQRWLSMNAQPSNSATSMPPLRFLLLGVTAGVRNIYTYDFRAAVTKEDAALWLGLMGKLRAQIEQLDATPESQGP